MKGLACRERSDRVTEATGDLEIAGSSRTLAHYQAIRVTSSTRTSARLKIRRAASIGERRETRERESGEYPKPQGILRGRGSS